MPLHDNYPLNPNFYLYARGRPFLFNGTSLATTTRTKWLGCGLWANPAFPTSLRLVARPQ